MEVLSIEDSGVKYLPDLSRLKNLEAIALSSNQLENIEFSGSGARLKTLDISNNPISDVTTITNMKGLTKLTLGGDRLREIPSLSGLTALNHLIVKNTPLMDNLAFVAGSSALETLRLQGLGARSLAPLVSCQNLKWLEIDDLPIDSLRDLEGVPALEKVFLHGTNVSDDEILRFMNARPDVVTLKMKFLK